MSRVRYFSLGAIVVLSLVASQALALEVLSDEQPNNTDSSDKFDETLDLIDLKNTLEKLLPIAKSGDALSAYRVGKIYHNHKSNFSDPTPNALFWLFYADALGEPRANTLLQQYSRNGYRFEMYVMEGRLVEELSINKMNQIDNTFPEKTYYEFTDELVNIFQLIEKRNLRIEAITELSSKKDVEICRDAINLKLSGWDNHWRSAGAVEEAKRRNLTFDKCRTELEASAFSK